MELSQVPVEAIKIDGGTQQRVRLDDEYAEELAEVLNRDEHLPPVLVYYDGSDYWLADGFHRLLAHVIAEREVIECHIRKGTCRDAILASVEANHTHGLRRTNDDKRRAVLTLLRDEKWSQWSNAEIARRAGVSDYLVARIRDEIGDKAPAKRKAKRGDTEYEIDTSGISETRSDEPEQEKDRFGQEFPDEQTKDVLTDVEVDDIIDDLRAMKRRIVAMANGPCGACMSAKELDIIISDAINHIKMGAPFAVCPHYPACEDGCKVCRGRKWVSRSVWNALPKNLRAK